MQLRYPTFTMKSHVFSKSNYNAVACLEFDCLKGIIALSKSLQMVQIFLKRKKKKKHLGINVLCLRYDRMLSENNTGQPKTRPWKIVSMRPRDLVSKKLRTVLHQPSFCWHSTALGSLARLVRVISHKGSLQNEQRKHCIGL